MADYLAYMLIISGGATAVSILEQAEEGCAANGILPNGCIPFVC